MANDGQTALQLRAWRGCWIVVVAGGGDVIRWTSKGCPPRVDLVRALRVPPTRTPRFSLPNFECVLLVI